MWGDDCILNLLSIFWERSQVWKLPYCSSLSGYNGLYFVCFAEKPLPGQLYISTRCQLLLYERPYIWPNPVHHRGITWARSVPVSSHHPRCGKSEGFEGILVEWGRKEWRIDVFVEWSVFNVCPVLVLAWLHIAYRTSITLMQRKLLENVACFVESDIDGFSFVYARLLLT